MLDNDMRELNQNIQKLNKSMGSFWVGLVRGLFTGFGSVLGAGLAILLIGWFLNVIGVIPAFQKQAEQWREVFIQTSNPQSFISPEATTQPVAE